MPGFLKHKMETKNICRGQRFQLTTQGSSPNIVHWTPEKKINRIELKKVSFGTIMELVKSLELSKKQTKELKPALKGIYLKRWRLFISRWMSFKLLRKKSSWMEKKLLLEHWFI